MSDSTVRGVVHQIEATKTYGQKGFRKRLVVLEQDKGNFTNYIPIDFIQDRELAGMAHVASYDFNMIQKVGQMAGFSKVERRTFDAETDVSDCPGQIFANLTK